MTDRTLIISSRFSLYKSSSLEPFTVVEIFNLTQYFTLATAEFVPISTECYSRGFKSLSIIPPLVNLSGG